MILTSLVAVSDNNVIGKDNDLIWHLPKDLKHFKKLTTGHTMIMGRKTWEAIGAKPLPKRKHIVITRNEGYRAEGAIVVTSVNEALKQIEDDQQAFIIGGAEIFNLTMSIVNQIEITYVHHDFEGDTFFADLKKEDWELVWQKKFFKDEKHKYDFTFARYDRAIK
jgi:dihydrofolate reductase